MPLTLVPITSATAFPPLMRVLYAAQEDPPIGALALVTPVLGTGPKARDDSIQMSTARLWFLHCCDLGSRWMSVVDDETGEVIAGSWWSVVDMTTPTRAPKADTQEQSLAADPFWLPEGSEIRRYAVMILAKSAASHSGRQRRHVGVASLANRPL